MPLCRMRLVWQAVGLYHRYDSQGIVGVIQRLLKLPQQMQAQCGWNCSGIGQSVTYAGKQIGNAGGFPDNSG